MNAMAQSTYHPEQPGVPTKTWICQQPAEQPTPPVERSTPFKFVQVVQVVQPQPIDVLRFQAAFSAEYRAILAIVDKQIQNVERLASQGALVERTLVHQDTQLDQLQKFYVFDHRARVGAFIARNQLRGLLMQAREPLIAAFGKSAIKRLSVVEDDEGSEMLFCLIAVSDGVHEARRALRFFDERWWLAHCGRAAGRLNFDFDLI